MLYHQEMLQGTKHWIPVYNAAGMNNTKYGRFFIQFPKPDLQRIIFEKYDQG